MPATLAADFIAATGSEPVLPDGLPPDLSQGRGELTVRFLDSFDWRLHRAGLELAVEARDGHLEAVCPDRGKSRRRTFPISQPPRFAADLPADTWAKPLADALDIRLLAPRVELRVRRSTWLLDAGQGDPPLSLSLDQAETGGIVLAPRWRLLAPATARKAFRAVRGRLAAADGLVPAPWSPLDEALQALSLRPADPSALADSPLDPGLRADVALKQVLRGLRHTLSVNEEGVREGLDTEFLHDYRVAVRRTRSLLGQLGRVFPEPVRARFLRDFGALAAMTSESRDLDVFLLALPVWEQALPGPLRGGLVPLGDYLRRRARAAHERLNRHLASGLHRRRLTAWEAFLEKPVPRRPRAERALDAIGTAAGRRIWKLYRRTLRQGGAIGPESPAEQLHELRKTAKKLRYLMELFRGLYPAEQLRPLVRDLKRLQDNLGEFQDVCVQIERLCQLAADLRAEGAPLEALLALGALLDRLYARETEARARYAERFAEFARDERQRRFRALFKPSGSGKTAEPVNPDAPSKRQHPSENL